MGVNKLRKVIPKVDILLLTVTNLESKALLSEMMPLDDQEGILQGSLSVVTYRIGLFGNYCAAHTELIIGTPVPYDSASIPKLAFDEIKPKAVFLLGNAFGLKKDKQRVGDVLIAKSILPYKTNKFGDNFLINKGEEILCGNILSERFRTRKLNWEVFCDGRKIEIFQGLVLSGQDLIDKQLSEALVREFPTALGGEKQDAASYSFISSLPKESQPEIILVKSVWQWADSIKNDRAKTFAAFTSVSLAKHVLSQPDVLQPIIKEKIIEVQSNQQDDKNNSTNLSLKERNSLLVEATLDIFGAKKGVPWAEVKRNLSADQVRQIYKVVANLWPLGTNMEGLLPKNNNKLVGIYTGDINPTDIVKNILRFGLYADELMIIDPFHVHSPHYWRGNSNPIETPERYKADTLKLVYFIYVLEPWIKTGLVKLVPEPGVFDLNMYFGFADLAAKRMKETAIEKDLDQYAQEMMSSQHEEMRRIFVSQSNEAIEQIIRKTYPNFTTKQVKETLQYFIDYRTTDPVALEQPLVSGTVSGFRGGANLETILYICNLTGSFPFTGLPWKWKEILAQQKDLNEDAKTWTPLTKAFQDLDFNFLNSVDHRFAVEMRQDGRLENFRTFLRKIWNSTNKGLAGSSTDSTIRDYKDELIVEYHKAQAEWDKITRDLALWGGSSTIISAASAASAILTGNMSLSIPAIALSAYGLLKVVTSRMEKKEFRKKFPMAVFVDLKNKNKVITL